MGGVEFSGSRITCDFEEGCARVCAGACDEAGALGHCWAWLPKNVARNSHVNLSNFETGPLELQRLWAVLNFRVAELRATLRRSGGVVERLENPLIGGLFGGCQALYSSAIRFVASR